MGCIKMEINQNGIDLIKKFEGLSLKPYKDAAQLWTIGYGHLIKGGEYEKFKDGITQQEAEELLKEDMAWAERAVNKYVKVDINQNQFDALVCLVFNIGAKAFFDSTLLKWINKPKDVAEIPKQFVRWIRAGGKPLLGLARRRVAESELFLK
jgi:GH24 family phage-related lysozyme (muramidase)